MLDMFLISDDVRNPEFPDELQMLGGLELEQHKALEEVFNTLKNEGVPAPYFDDSRLNSNQVLLVLDLLNNYSSEHKIKNEYVKNSFEQFRSIIEKAVSNRCGILSFCD